jgi:hypothetical protein
MGSPGFFTWLHLAIPYQAQPTRADFLNYQKFSLPSMDREYLEQSTIGKILAIATIFPFSPL